MRKWCWLLAGVALSCGEDRDFVRGGGGGAEQPSGGSTAGGTSQSGSDSGGAGAANAGAAGEADDPTTAGGEQGNGGQAPEECEGCWIDGACVAEGAVDPEDPCRACRKELRDDDYSVNVGAECGSPATECSAQDTCSSLGVCEPNDEESGQECGSFGACEDGICRPRPNPFDCIAPNPPTVEFTAMVYVLPGSPPAAKGGTIAPGRYTPTRFDLYGAEQAGIDIRTFEFAGGYVQAATQYYSLQTMGAFIPEVRFAGSFATDNGVLQLDVERCDPQYTIDIPTLSYTATANGLVTIASVSGGGTLVTSYARQ